MPSCRSEIINKSMIFRSQSRRFSPFLLAPVGKFSNLFGDRGQLQVLNLRPRFKRVGWSAWRAFGYHPAQLLFRILNHGEILRPDRTTLVAKRLLQLASPWPALLSGQPAHSFQNGVLARLSLCASHSGGRRWVGTADQFTTAEVRLLLSGAPHQPDSFRPAFTLPLAVLPHRARRTPR